MYPGRNVLPGLEDFPFQLAEHPITYYSMPFSSRLEGWATRVDLRPPEIEDDGI
jgi:hypothetical protein